MGKETKYAEQPTLVPSNAQQYPYSRALSHSPLQQGATCSCNFSGVCAFKDQVHSQHSKRAYDPKSGQQQEGSAEGSHGRLADISLGLLDP